MVKASRYNLYFPSAHTGLHLIYNTLTEGTVLLSDANLGRLRSDPGTLPDNVRAELRLAGLVVEATADERRVFRVNHNRLKYSTQEAYVMLYTTYACNAACTYCYEGFLTQTKGVRAAMGAETTQAASRFMRRLASETGLGTLRLFFFGGEPLLNQEPILTLLAELGPWAETQGIDFTSGICTNGTIALGGILPRLAEARAFLHFTLDGPQAVHDARRPYAGGKGTYEDILRNIELTQRAGLDFGIRVNVDRENAPHVGTLLEDLRSRLGPGLNLRFAEVVPPVGKESNTCSWAKQCLVGTSPRTLTSLISRARALGHTVVVRPLRDWVFCEFLREHSYIVDPLGDVYKCEGLAGLRDHRAGTLLPGGDLEPTFRLYDWISHDPLESACADCVYLPACGGGCPCLTYEEAGTYHSGGCSMFKSLLRGFIEYYLESAYPGILAPAAGEEVTEAEEGVAAAEAKGGTSRGARE